MSLRLLYASIGMCGFSWVTSLWLQTRTVRHIVLLSYVQGLVISHKVVPFQLHVATVEIQKTTPFLSSLFTMIWRGPVMIIIIPSNLGCMCSGNSSITYHINGHLAVPWSLILDLHIHIHVAGVRLSLGVTLTEGMHGMGHLKLNWWSEECHKCQGGARPSTGQPYSNNYTPAS